MKIRCPSCGHEVEPVANTEKGIFCCPQCEEEVPATPQAAVKAAEEGEDVLPGLKPGDRLGAYEVTEFMSSGGMAVLLKGKQLSLNRNVAIKVLPKRFTSNRVFVSRFESEAAALAGLNHPNVVSVIDRGKEGDFYYIVMEYIEGEDLRRRLSRQGLLEQEETLGIMRQLLAALQYAHERNIAHRDVKPGNVMIAKDGLVKVTDFGLAQLTSDKMSEAHTITGQTMGTLKYMAPEQLFDSKHADARADLYSAGVVLYELLTGHMPVGAFRLPSDLVPDVDPRIDDVILKVLRTDPEERYASAREFAAALEQIAKTPRAMGEEEASEFVAAQVGAEAPKLFACSKCGFVSRPDARACARCQASLEHLFESCPACAAGVRGDVPICPNCGENLRARRAELRRETMERQARVKALVGNRQYSQYEEALAELRKLAELRGPIYEQVRNSGKSWLARVEKRLVVQRQHTYDGAVRLLAESNCEKAIKLLEKLPSDYQDVGALLRRARERMQTGMEYRAKAQAADEGGDRQTALTYYRKAADVWPHDQKLQRIMGDIKIDIANKKMVRKYLDEAREAAAKENYAEAIALCRRATELDPSDASVMELLLRLEGQEAEAHAEAPRGPYMTPDGLKIPGMRRNRLPFLIALGCIAVAAAIAGMILLTEKPRAESGAGQRMLNAAELEKRGDFAMAYLIYSAVAKDYDATTFAALAKQKVKFLGETMEKCKGFMDKAESLARDGRLFEAGETYKALIRDSDCRRYFGAVNEARRSMDELAILLADDGKKLETEKRLRLAWRQYTASAALAQTESPSLRESIRRVEEAMARVEDLVAKADREMRIEEFAGAAKALGEAERLMPGHRRAQGLIRELLPRLPAPAGMVYVPEGEFYYGADDGDPDEAPRRKAVIDFGYYLDVNEVTNADYAGFIRANPRVAPPSHWVNGAPPGGEERMPVVNITAAEAEKYAAWARKRLPTEMEWERAARAVWGSKYPWGNDWTTSGGVFQFAPAPVGLCAQDISPAGCKDMAGNAAEWTASLWNKEPGARVVKGGSWAGPEPERMIRPVFAEPPAKPQKGVRLALVDSPTTPVLPVMYDRNVRMTLAGISGSRERADVAVAKWIENRKQWVTTHFVVEQAERIGGRKQVLVRFDDPRGRVMTVDFTTGCTFIGITSSGDLVMKYTDPEGLQREMAKSAEPRLLAPPFLKPWVAPKPPPVAPAKGREAAASPPAGKTAPAPAPKAPPIHHLMDIPRCANRTKAPAAERFINVGFRCARTPELVAPFVNAMPEPENLPLPTRLPPEASREEAAAIPQSGTAAN